MIIYPEGNRFPDGELKKLGKARTPTELEEKYKVTEKMFA